MSLGGAVHNLYRNSWAQVAFYRDSYAQERPPEQWAIDFGNAFSDVVTKNSGPALKTAMGRMMNHPQYRDAVSELSDDLLFSKTVAVGNHWLRSLLLSNYSKEQMITSCQRSLSPELQEARKMPESAITLVRRIGNC